MLRLEPTRRRQKKKKKTLSRTLATSLDATAVILLFLLVAVGVQ